MCSFIIIFLFVLNGCSTEKKDWNQTRTNNTIDSYTAFIKQHPESQHVDSAKVLIKEIEKKNKLDKIMVSRDINALKIFLSDSTNKEVLKRYKYGVGDSIKLVSQPEKVKKGYTLSLKASKKHGEFDYLLTIPPNTSVDLDYDNITIHIIKGEIGMSIKEGRTAGYVTTNKEATILIELKDKRAITLSAERIDIDSNMFVYLNKSEFIITRIEGTSIRRDLSNNIFYLIKGGIYYIKFN
jgi:hypothetical protein